VGGGGSFSDKSSSGFFTHSQMVPFSVYFSQKKRNIKETHYTTLFIGWVSGQEAQLELNSRLGGGWVRLGGGGKPVGGGGGVGASPWVGGAKQVRLTIGRGGI
jgi:hypothetical protein